MKKAWSTYAQQMLAIVHAEKIWHPYLLGCRFTIVTDQQALRHLMKQKIVTPEQQEFPVKLLGFEYYIIYQQGKEKKVVETLSSCEGSSILEMDHRGDENDEMVSRFPHLTLEGKDVLEGGGMTRPLRRRPWIMP